MPSTPRRERPPSTGARLGVERRSRPVLLWLSRQPKLLVPLLSVGLLVGGLVAPPPVGVVLLVLLVALVGWLSYLSWPVVEPGGRLVRVVTLAMLVVLAATRL